METTASSFFSLLWPILGLTVLGMGVYALFNVMSRRDMEEGKRLRWLMCIVLIPIIGPLLYIVMGRK